MKKIKEIRPVGEVNIWWKRSARIGKTVLAGIRLHLESRETKFNEQREVCNNTA